MVFFCSDESRNVLVEKLEYKRNAVGKDKVLTHELKLINMVELEVLQQKKKYSRYGLHYYLLVSVHIDAKSH